MTAASMWCTVSGVNDGGLEDVDQDLLRRADKAGKNAFERRLGIERHAPNAVRADGSRRRRILRLRKVAAETLGHEPGGLGVAPFLHRAHGEEELQVGRPALETEAQQQRRALGDGAVLAPRTAAPVHLRCQELLGAVALGVELLPRDVGLRIPLERLGPAPQIPHVGHRRSERQRIALLEDVSSRALLLDEHGFVILYLCAYLCAPIACRARRARRVAARASRRPGAR